MVSAHAVETAVLSAIGAEPHLVSRDQEAAIRSAVRKVVYYAESGNLALALIKTPDGAGVI